MSEQLEVTILGCGSSGGVPRLGGADGSGFWGACDPSNPRNRRRRCSLLVRRKAAGGATQVLVDSSPDMREQLLDARAATLDGVLITHNHADQLHGLDDLRMIAINMRKRVDVWSDESSLEGILSRFAYCFVQAPGSDYPPVLNARRIDEPYAGFAIGGAGGDIPVLPFRQGHGAIHSLGFRFGPIAYSSDVHTLDEDAFAALAGVKLWIVDALRYAPHPTHSHVERTLQWIERVAPARAIITNMHVDLDYEKLKSELPPKVVPAYDGLCLTECL